MIHHKTSIFGVRKASFWLWCEEAQSVTFEIKSDDQDDLGSELTLFFEGDPDEALASMEKAVADARLAIAKRRAAQIQEVLP